MKYELATSKTTAFGLDFISSNCVTPNDRHSFRWILKDTEEKRAICEGNKRIIPTMAIVICEKCGKVQNST